MPQWIHDRAKHLMSKNPDMPESEAWAVATQQSHALGKTPKGYGTVKGKEKAKAKFNTPEDDVAVANPKTKEAFILNELVKLGAVSEEQARRSMDRLDMLERSKPSTGQIGRYAAIGAAAGPAIKVMSNVVKGKPLADFGQIAGSGIKGVLRGAAGDAVAGAATAGAVPLLRGHFDRKAEMGTLKKYVHQYNQSNNREDASVATPSPVAPTTKFASRIARLFPKATSSIRRQSWDLDKAVLQTALNHEGKQGELEKSGFQQSMYGSTGGYVDWHQASSMPGFRRPHPSTNPMKKQPDALYGVKAASFLTEEELFYKLANDTNIGQWWEQVGGPHLASGGSHEEFEKKMHAAGLPDAVKKKFMGVAKEKYPPGFNTRRAPPPSGAYGSPFGHGYPYGSPFNNDKFKQDMNDIFSKYQKGINDINEKYNKRMKTLNRIQSGVLIGSGVLAAGGLALEHYGAKRRAEERARRKAMKTTNPVGQIKAAEEEKEAGVITPTGITPAARLASSMRIGAPKITSPSGPSIGDIAKPKGFGQKIPGATKP